MSGPPRHLPGDDGHDALPPDDDDVGGRGPARPYVPRRDSTRAHSSSRGRGSRAQRPAPPFSGRGLQDADDAWQIVHVHAEPGHEQRGRPADRASAHRWQAIEIGFEEWGRGALVLVGVPKQRPRSASTTSGGGPGPEQTAAAARSAVDEAPSVGPADSSNGREDVEMVAVALETIALRVRVGEFRVRGLVPGMTDAAVLAATLASILAPRR